MNRKLNYNDYRWRVWGFPFSSPWFITTPAASPLVTKIMATGFSPLGSSAYSSTTPKIAIMQPAIPVKDWRYYEKTIIAMEDGAGKLYKEYKDGETWRAQYKTWEDACVPLDKSRRQVDRIILKQVDGHADFLAKTTNRTECPNTTPQQKKETLQSIAKLPNPPQEEEPEKPRIKTADEELAETTPPMDASGCLVPQHLLAIRERHEEVTQAAYWASKLKALWESIQNESDPLFAHAKNSGTVGTFMNGAASMHATLRECLPEVVCPQCQAKSKTCHTCCGSGWISEVRWNREWVKSSDRLKQTEVQRRAAIKAKYAK